MNNEPEKAVRPRWQIVILMVAASIAWRLILSYLAGTGLLNWYPDHLAYFIVMLVALFIIYWILFLFSKNFRKSLIQENIPAEPKKTLSLREKSLQSLKQFIELVFYPLHLAFRLIARLMLVFAIPITFLIPHLILILILLSISNVIQQEPLSNWLLSIEKTFTNNYETLTNWLQSIAKTLTNNSETQTDSSIDDISTITQIFLLFGGLSVFTFLFKREDILTPIFNMAKKTFDVVRYTWLPGVDIVESLLNTWRYTIKMIGRSIKKTCIESIKLLPAVFFLCIGVYLSSIPAKTFINWTFQQNIAPQNVIVLNSSDFSPSYLFEKGTRFSLAYTSPGSLSTKTGICPKGSNEEWLKLFKKSIIECSEKERVKLKIQGFASVAPIGPDATKSKIFNYQIANERAEALIYFLMLPPDSIYTEEKCKDVLNNNSLWERNKENGTRVKLDSPWWKAWGVTVSTEEVSPEKNKSESKSRLRHTFAVSDSDTKHKGKGFDVIYEPWQSYEKMKDAKPADDGSLPKPRYYPIEFLNRTAQIIIEESGCLTKEVPAVPKVEDNAEESD